MVKIAVPPVIPDVPIGPKKLLDTVVAAFFGSSLGACSRLCWSYRWPHPACRCPQSHRDRPLLHGPRKLRSRHRE